MLQQKNGTQVPAEELVLISSRTEIWSGTVAIAREADLGSVGNELPPKTVVHDGRKILISPKRLAKLESLRKSVERSLKADGFAYAGCGIAVTREVCEQFLHALPGYEQRFNAALDELCTNLDDHYAEMEANAGTWSDMLKASRLTAQQVRARCTFGFNIFRMSSPGGAADAVYQGTLAEAVPSLLEAIAKDAANLDKRIGGKSKLLESQVTAIRDLVGKLKRFQFLDPRVGPATDGMLTILQQVPATGTAQGSSASICTSLLGQLMDPARILTRGTQVIADEQAQMTMVMTPVATVAPTPQPTPASEPATPPLAQPTRPASAAFVMGM